jgi:hypothetical protein
MSTSTSLGAMLPNPLPLQRAGRVYPRLPAWLLPALRDSYAGEVGGGLKNDDDALSFLRSLNRECGCTPFDHCGSDADQNFCAEPYARRCSVCRTAAAKFAQRLGVRFVMSITTFHAPGAAVRFTFYKP